MRFTNREKKLYLIRNYFKNLEKNEEIIKYLYNHTELFERKYMEDFPQEEFRFFAAKIGYLAKQKNKFYEIASKQDIEDLKEIELLEN